jgi:hypothetical protein
MQLDISSGLEFRGDPWQTKLLLNLSTFSIQCTDRSMAILFQDQSRQQATPRKKRDNVDCDVVFQKQCC